MDNSADVTSTAPVAEPAESSPATTTTPDTGSSSKFEVPKDPKAYKEWREKGTLPGQSKSKKEDSASSSDQSAEGEEPTGEKDAPATDAGGKKQETLLSRTKATAADRLQEILGDLKRAGLTPSELKTFKREAAHPRRALEKYLDVEQQAPEAKASPEKTAQPPATEAKQPPKLEDFKTWAEFQQAEREFNDQSIDERVERKFQERMLKEQADQRMREAKQRYGDEAEEYIRTTATNLFNNADVPPVLKAVLNESPVLADVLYVMGTNQKDFDEFIDLAKTNPGQALRKAVLLEQLVQEELAKGGKAAAASNGEGSAEQPPERDESGKFVSNSKPPAQRKPAPPPASEVSGKASAPPDEVQSAFARGDVRAYFKAMNRRDLAARQGR